MDKFLKKLHDIENLILENQKESERFFREINSLLDENTKLIQDAQNNLNDFLEDIKKDK